MTDFIRYKVWCDSESAYVLEDVYRDADAAVPTVCPNDGAHTIDTAKTVVYERHNNTLPVQDQSDGTQAVRIDPLQHPPGWTYLSLGFLAEITAAQAADTRIVSYHLITDEAGAAMAQFRAWTGKCIPVNCNIKDKFKVEIVVKGSAVGGVDDATGALATAHNDVVLDQFIRDMHPVNDVVREFTEPDKSLLLTVDDASLLNPALPAGADIYFKLVYVPAVTTVADQFVTFDLEGFEPPAGA